MMLNDTFNNINISVCLRRLGLWCLTTLLISCLFQTARVMVLNDTFNNISVCFRGRGLWCLTTLSTIFRLALEG